VLIRPLITPENISQILSKSSEGVKSRQRRLADFMTLAKDYIV
jgi:hypothetical protein